MWPDVVENVSECSVVLCTMYNFRLNDSSNRSTACAVYSVYLSTELLNSWAQLLISSGLNLFMSPEFMG